MIQIAIVVPYFGRFPKYFDLWLISVKYNPSVRFIIFTDDRTRYEYPENVTVVYVGFDELKARISNCFDFKINLDKPYKLCDFKPAYGRIFQKELDGYDYWGHCDIDLIFGNIRKYLPDQQLAGYDKILTKGHLTLYKNTSAVNEIFMTKLPGYITYKDAFSHWANFCFDESSLTDKIWSQRKVLSRLEWVADIEKKRRNFAITPSNTPVPQLFMWKNGELSCYKMDDNGNVQSGSFLYIHLQTRKMPIHVNVEDCKDGFLITPNGFMGVLPVGSETIGQYGWKNGLIDRNWEYYKKFLARVVDKGLYEVLGYRRGLYLMPERKFLSKGN